jgi:hypothetical protein
MAESGNEHRSEQGDFFHRDKITDLSSRLCHQDMHSAE